MQPHIESESLQQAVDSHPVLSLAEAFVELYGDGNGTDFTVSRDGDAIKLIVGEVEFVRACIWDDDQDRFVTWFSADCAHRFTLPFFKRPRSARKTLFYVYDNPRPEESRELWLLVNEQWRRARGVFVQQVHCIEQL